MTGTSASEGLRRALGSLEGLEAVESIIGRKLGSEVTLLTAIAEYLRELGGKRIRPVLALLTGKLCGLDQPVPGLLDIAAGIELIHMATLLHDDIIDQSPLRRRRTSPYLQFGVNNTLLTGDFLLVRAFSLCSRLDQAIVEATEQACVHLVEGEIMEAPLPEITDRSLDRSLEIARKKTAALFRLAAFCGAHIAEAPETAQLHLAAFGEYLGVAFQILDDILDVTADENLLGKKSGSDLTERKPSIVNILWLESGSALSQRLLSPKETILAESNWVAAALQELRQSQVIEQARALALSYAEKAEQKLEAAFSELLEPNAASFLLLKALLEFTTRRIS